MCGITARVNRYTPLRLVSVDAVHLLGGLLPNRRCDSGYAGIVDQDVHPPPRIEGPFDAVVGRRVVVAHVADLQPHLDPLCG